MSLLPARELAAMAGVVNLTANARLIAIAPTGAPDPRGNTTPATAAWTGSAPGFLAREDLEQVTGRGEAGGVGRAVIAHIDTFVLLDANTVPITEVAGPRWKGTYVTIEDRRLPAVVTTR